MYCGHKYLSISILALLSCIAFLEGCNVAGTDVDKLIGIKPTTINVPTPTASDLTIEITSPATGSSAGYNKVISGTCGTAIKPIQIEVSGQVTLAVCGADRTWEATVSLVGLPTGSLTVTAKMIDEATNLEGTPHSITLNRITNICDSESARSTATASGTGTPGDPYGICSITQFNGIRNNLTSSFVVYNDLDFGGSQFVTIPGTFTGDLFGNNFTVSNMVISSAAASQVAIFFQTTNVTIENITFYNIQVTGNFRVGVLAGYITPGTNVIDNVNVRNSTLTSTHATNGETGAIIGRVRDLTNNTIIRNCTGTNNTIVSQNNAGGLIGYIDASTAFTLEDSSVVGGSVTGAQNVGGAVGGSVHTTAVFTRVTSSASVTGSNGNIGGLFGSVYGTVTDCRATGNVVRTGGNNVGGLIGTFVGAASSLVGTEAAATRADGVAPPETCFASGTINASGASYVGGLIGLNAANTVSKCYYSGSSIVGGASRVAGLIGESSGTTITDVFSTGNVSGEGSYVAGLVGYMTNTTLGITDCYATGNVSTQGLVFSYIGGLIGRFRTIGSGGIAMDRCHFTGSISAEAGDGSGITDYVGGLAGWAEIANLTIQNSYSTGNITVTSTGGTFQHIGGLVGYSEHHISNSYYSGTLIVTGPALGVGGIAGSVNGRTVSDSYFNGAEVRGGTQVGGIVGRGVATGTIIQDAYSTGNVTSTTGQYVGGIAGYTRGNILRSYSRGTITGAGNYVGGIEGGNSTDTTRNLHECFSLAIVNGGNALYVGGISGYFYANTDRFLNNFFAGQVRGGQDVGGLVGYLRRQGNSGMRRSYSVGYVYRTATAPGAEGTFGALVGTINGAANVIESTTNFYLNTVAPVQEPGNTALAAPNTTNQNSLNAAQMVNSANFTGFDFTGPPPVWSMPPAATSLPGESGAYVYPVLYWWL